MDEMVRQAMAKWPQVPACFNWLGLDARGQWRLRDDSVQQLGAFNSGVSGALGSVLRHEKLIAFIQRNYEPDEMGRWFFQNGPQRVYVELAAAPWVWRINEIGQLAPLLPEFSAPQMAQKFDFSGAWQVLSSWVDEAGWLYAHTPSGLGLVHSLDVGLAAQLIELGKWQPEPVLRAELEARFGFVSSPAVQGSSVAHD